MTFIPKWIVIVVFILIGFGMGQQITCLPDEHCIINCTVIDATHGCDNQIIDGIQSLSLQIICLSSSENSSYIGGCQSSQIYCPELNNSLCSIDCINDDSCFNTNINMVTNNILNLMCRNTDSCSDINITGPNYNTDISINCMQPASCDNINIIAPYANNIIISCTGNALSYMDSICKQFTVFATNVVNEIKLMCYGYYSCYNMDIYANYSNNLIIDGKGRNAVYFGNIFAQNAQYMLISCKSKNRDSSCYDTNFWISSISTSLECQGYGCKHLQLYSSNGFIDIKNVTVNGCNQCSSVSDCINKWEMHCDHDSFYNYRCAGKYRESYDGSYNTCRNDLYYLPDGCGDGPDGCNCSDWKALGLMDNGWNDIQGNKKCDLGYPDKSCENDKDCIINYIGWDGGSSISRIIFGNNATSMTVNCVDFGCYDASIYCPETPGSECNIVCSYLSCKYAEIYGGTNSIVNIECNHEGCSSMKIFGDTNSIVNIECKSNLGAQVGACKYMKIFGDTNSIVNIECINSWACYSMKIFVNDTFKTNINCRSYASCYDIVIYGDNANSIDLNCRSYKSCEYFTIFASNAQRLNLSCIADWACAPNYIFSNNTQNIFINAIGDNSLHTLYDIYAQNAASLSITCATYNNDTYGCYANIYVPSNGETNLNCVGYGCTYLNIYANNMTKYIANVSFNDCKQCMSIDSCIGNWSLFCDNNYNTTTVFTGTQCTDNALCDCNELKKQIQNSWNYHVQSSNICIEIDTGIITGSNSNNMIINNMIIIISTISVMVFICSIGGIIYYIKCRNNTIRSYSDVSNSAVEGQNNQADIHAL